MLLNRHVKQDKKRGNPVLVTRKLESIYPATMCCTARCLFLPAHLTYVNAGTCINPPMYYVVYRPAIPKYETMKIVKCIGNFLKRH